MTLRIAQFVASRNDVIDDAFLRDFPGVEAAKADSEEALPAALAGAEALITTNSAFTPDFARLVREHGTALKWIQFTTVGIDIALEAGLPDGLWITNTGGLMQKTLATHAIALMLAVQRGFHLYEPMRAAHDWARDELGQHLSAPEGGTMVILGMGRIGQDVARKARALDMEVICVTRAAAPAVPAIGRVVARERVDEVLPEADVVVVAMPIDETTHHFLSAGRLALMKQTAILVNISRGLVVDEAALAAALATGRLAGAGLDAFGEEPLGPESPFWDLPNVVMTPHIGGRDDAGQRGKMSGLIQENLRRYLAGEALMNVVRRPDNTLVGFDGS